MKAFILGARNGNIGSAISKRLLSDGWMTRSTDCAIGDGSRPPGGILPDDETAREHGYNVTEKGRYQRFDAPSVQEFERFDADACIISLGATYKDHFTQVKEYDLERVIRACLTLPLIAARRFVQATEANRREHQPLIPERRDIVFIGSYAHNHPFTNGTAYCAAKAGINMAARTLGWELTDRGYRVFCVHPFHVQGTPMWDQVERDVMASKNMSWEEADAYNRKDLKMPDLCTPAEVADVVATILKEPSMGWLSGTNVELFGGTR